MHKLLYILTIGALWWPATAAAQHHGHHATRHRARAAAVQREYWSIFEEWLTPQEGREVELDVCQQLNAVSDDGVVERC